MLRLLEKSFSQPLGYTIAAGALGKPGLFPATFPDDLHYTGADVHDMTHSPTGYHHRHESSCHSTTMRRPHHFRERSRSSGCIEKSVTSLHSSGHDSGIAENTLHCQCGQSSSQESDASCNSYEDSLRSVPTRKSREATMRQLNKSHRSMHQRRQRNRSITDDIIQSPGGLQRMQSLTHLPPPAAIFVPGPSALRRSTERLMMTCPRNP
ncbi:hypothetical protein NQ317_004640 [Molorchus minor]|uniref:Uncharacterized protein n=1 Tax=Molorchus minor TaxID=1323400 RepID=A0ABQ9ITP0_9CUCU|nr:hypothetical protein NQ317_004640 [Molorchus minor]